MGIIWGDGVWGCGCPMGSGVWSDGCLVGIIWGVGRWVSHGHRMGCGVMGVPLASFGVWGDGCSIGIIWGDGAWGDGCPMGNRVWSGGVTPWHGDNGVGGTP